MLPYFHKLAKSVAPVEVEVVHYTPGWEPEHGLSSDRFFFVACLAETRALDDETKWLLKIPMDLTFVVRTAQVADQGIGNLKRDLLVNRMSDQCGFTIR